jgi:hypothetical protein
MRRVEWRLRKENVGTPEQKRQRQLDVLAEAMRIEEAEAMRAIE